MAAGWGRSLYQVSSIDPLALAGAPPVLAGVAAVACLLPAARASQVDPTTALRAD
ncbi:MAG: hypothetical protein AB7U83_13365 [Vicinamibacterales bacterium]